jgi:prepilin peptidase CpaA
VTVGILFIFVAICLFTDLTRRKIYNSVVLTGFAFALAVNMAVLGAGSGFVFTLKGFFTGLLLLLIPFVMGALGAGDVKMLAMVGAFVGSGQVFLIMLASAVAGGVYAMVVMVRSGTFFARMKKTLVGIYCFLLMRKTVHLDTLEDSANSKHAIPYGAAISAGVIIIYILGSMGYAMSVANATMM